MKTKVKMLVDIFMTVLLFFLMARQLTGDTAHEWLGAGMFLLWIVHHILNRHWFSHLFQGKYTPVRTTQTVINVALLLAMLGQMVSGIILSRNVFVFLPISGGIAMARSLHVFCGFWCFVLMSLHLGLHWNMMLGRMRKAIGGAGASGAGGNPEEAVDAGRRQTTAQNSRRKTRLPRIGAAAVALYGLYAFVKNQFILYMFRLSSFVFFDFERPVVLYVTEYLAIMGLFIWIAYYGVKGLQKLSGRRKKP